MRCVLPRFVIVLLCMCVSVAAQQVPQRDLEATVVSTQSATAMGGTVPSDSVATGTVTLVAGSKTDSGTVRILTRSTDQTSEQVTTADGSDTLVYSRGAAAEIQGSSSQYLQLELAVTCQSPDFPLPLLVGALNNADFAFQYVGAETFDDGSPVHHIRFWNTFASQPKLAPLADLSARDLWIDAVSGLPRKLSYVRRAARGAEPGILVEVFYSNFRDVGGALSPFLIQKSLNGTPWATMTITSVTLNAGLTDANFPVQ